MYSGVLIFYIFNRLFSLIQSDITFNDEMLGGRKWIPGVGGNLTFRYQFWTQMRYEGMMFREFLAVVYYKLKGWI